MSITELQVLEARLLLAKANREWYHGRSFCDYRDEIEQSDRELNLAYNARVDYLVEFNKTDLERLEERLEDAWVAVMAAEDAKESANRALAKRQSFYVKLNLELENLREQDK
tara:strand:+ start:46 stop:381 length:336 start_codon:yes stop_codon:yes gene_type:complete